jgi:hypothetical protein
MFGRKEGVVTHQLDSTPARAESDSLARAILLEQLGHRAAPA